MTGVCDCHTEIPPYQKSRQPPRALSLLSSAPFLLFSSQPNWEPVQPCGKRPPQKETPQSSQQGKQSLPKERRYTGEGGLSKNGCLRGPHAFSYMFCRGRDPIYSLLLFHP